MEQMIMNSNNNNVCIQNMYRKSLAFIRSDYDLFAKAKPPILVRFADTVWPYIQSCRTARHSAIETPQDQQQYFIKNMKESNHRKISKFLGAHLFTLNNILVFPQDAWF